MILSLCSVNNLYTLFRVFCKPLGTLCRIIIVPWVKNIFYNMNISLRWIFSSPCVFKNFKSAQKPFTLQDAVHLLMMATQCSKKIVSSYFSQFLCPTSLLINQWSNENSHKRKLYWKYHIRIKNRLPHYLWTSVRKQPIYNSF